MATKPYKIRPLIGTDIFKISKFIKKLGLEKIQQLMSGADFSKAINNIMNGGQDIAEIGKLLVGFVSLVIDSLCEVEDELLELLESVSNLSREEIGALPMDDFISMITDLFKQKTFKDFFRRMQAQFAKQSQTVEEKTE